MKYKKNTTLFFLSFILMSSTLFAQGVSINITGTKSDSSAMLDINHSNKGLLIPRVGLQNVNDALTIRKPAHSLLAFNINPSFMGGEGYYYNNGTPQFPIWIKLTTSNDNSNTNSWLASGNANLTDLAFLGTTDDANLIFKRNNEEVAQFYPGGTVVFTGNGSEGIVPAGVNGTGSRMMWVPALGAFRVGSVDGPQWDKDSIAPGSFATGFNTIASGIYSIAMGYIATASGVNSMAIGFNAEASGSNATAIGFGAEASGSNATAIGFGAEASGNVSVAMGNTTKAIGNNSTALGEGTLANVRGGLAMGRYNEEVIIDPNAVTSNDRIFQIGNGTTNINRNDIFYIRRNGKVIANDIELMSDIRLKKNITPLKEALSKIANIQPIIYNFINTQMYPGDRQIGFSAQEVQKQFPELVSENEKGYLSVSYANMSAVAIQGIKEQQIVINQLLQAVSKLDETNKDLQNQIKELKESIKK